MSPAAEGATLCFAMRRGELAGKPIWVSRFTPNLFKVYEQWRKSKYYRGNLSEWILVNPTTDISFLNPDDVVSFVPMEAVGEDGVGINLQIATYSDVSKGYTRFAENDLIWAKITPCMQNGKSGVIRNLKFGVGFGSTEFHVLRSQKKDVNIDFVKHLLASDTLLLAAQGAFSGTAGQQRVPEQFLLDLPLPLPSIEIQEKLVSEMEAARATRQSKLAEAERLLAGIDSFVLDELGLKLPKEEKRKTFAVKFGEIKKRTDPDYHSPYFRNLRSAVQKSKFKVVKLSEILQKPLASGFAAGRNDQAEDEQEGVPHVRPFNISPNGQFQLESIKYVPRENISEGDWLTKDEILFNNTNSTEWVGKTAVFDSNEPCACSNHITRIFVKKEEAEPYFIAALFNAFRSLGLFGLLSTNFNNQAGINSETLAELEVLTPPLDFQQKIVAELQRRRTLARQLREEAESTWQEAKSQFEKALLG